MVRGCVGIPVLFLSLACGRDVAQQSRGCIRIGESVRLKGRVQDSIVYGAPGYRENKNSDARNSIAILTLRDPITVCHGVGKDSAYSELSDLKRLQIAGGQVPHTTSFRSQAPVFVVGRLYRATVPNEIIDPLIDLDSIKERK